MITRYPVTNALGPAGATGPTGSTGATGPAGGYQWTTLSKAADQAVINSNTLTDDTDLQFAMAASTKYRFRGIMFIDPTAASSGWNYSFTGPSSPTAVRIFVHVASAQGSWNIGSVAAGTSLPGSTSVTAVQTNQSALWVNCVFHNGVNSGTLKFRFCQFSAVNDAGCICRAGSYLEYAVT